MAKKKQENVKKVAWQREMSRRKMERKVLYKEIALKNKEIQLDMMMKKKDGYRKMEDGSFAKVSD